MTSREALENLYEHTDYNDYSNKTLNIVNESFEKIEKDLNRLEKLEQIIEIVKSIGLTFQKDLEYYDCDYGDWFKTPYAIENHPVSKEEWELFKEIFGGKNND